MRSLRRGVLVLLTGLAACESDARVLPVDVLWMDWPAEAVAGEPFRTRLVVWGVCALNPVFKAGASADQSAVTFAPYFLTGEDQILCGNLRATEVLLVTAVDTAGLAPGLAAEIARIYEMRAAAPVYTAQIVPAAPGRPVRTFGNVTVLPESPPTGSSLRNAAGAASLEVDTLGCVRLRPFGLYGPGATIVLENPSDTGQLSGPGALIRGYIFTPPAPVCGETRVFHLVSRN